MTCRNEICRRSLIETVLFAWHLHKCFIDIHNIFIHSFDTKTQSLFRNIKCKKKNFCAKDFLFEKFNKFFGHKRGVNGIGLALSGEAEQRRKRMEEREDEEETKKKSNLAVNIPWQNGAYKTRTHWRWLKTKTKSKHILRSVQWSYAFPVAHAPYLYIYVCIFVRSSTPLPMQDMKLRNHGKTFDKGFKSFRSAKKFSATPEIFYWRKRYTFAHTFSLSHTHREYAKLGPMHSLLNVCILAQNFVNQHAKQRFY